MPSGSRERLFRKGFKAAPRRGPRGQKGARHVWFDRARKNEIHCEERRERILSQSLRSFVRSFERPKGKTLLIASRIDSSKVGRGRRSRSLLDRSDAVFARPLTPLFKGFQNADAAAASVAAVAGGRVLSALVVPNDRRPKKGINPPACLPSFYARHDIYRFGFDPAPQLSAILYRDHKSSRN